MTSPARSPDRERLLLGLAAIVMFLLFFKPIIALTQYQAFDDQAYLKITADFLRIDYPLPMPVHSYPPGVILAWLPAGLAAIVYSWLFGVSETVALPIFVGLSSYAYWCASLFIVAAMIRHTVGATFTPRRLAVTSLLALLGVPVLYYATHRTTMAHAPEMFFAVLTAFFVIKSQPVRAFAAALMLCALRLNDVPVLLFALAPAVGAGWASTSGRRALRAIAWIALAAALGYVVWRGFVAGYNQFNFTNLIGVFSLSRIPEVLAYGDWGLLWTAPAWLLVLITATIRIRKMSVASRFALVWMWMELAICLAWTGNGSDFGYRYLIGSYAAALVVALELLRQDTTASLKSAITYLWAANACWLTWLTWIYKERPEFASYPNADSMFWNPDLMVNGLAGLFRMDAYLTPLPHSALGALYYSWIEPLSVYALPGGIAGPPFRLMAAACAFSVGWLLFRRSR